MSRKDKASLRTIQIANPFCIEFQLTRFGQVADRRRRCDDLRSLAVVAKSLSLQAATSARRDPFLPSAPSPTSLLSINVQQKRQLATNDSTFVSQEPPSRTGGFENSKGVPSISRLLKNLSKRSDLSFDNAIAGLLLAHSGADCSFVERSERTSGQAFLACTVGCRVL